MYEVLSVLVVEIEVVSVRRIVSIENEKEDEYGLSDS